MTTTLHPLAKRFPRLVNPEFSAHLNGFYNTLAAAMTEYEAAVAQARQVSPDYIPAKRAARQHEIIAQARKKLNDTLAKELQPLGASIGALRQEITLTSRPKTPDNAVLAYLQEMEHRRELREMGSELRAKLLRESCARGDRSLLTACENSLIPFIAPQIMDAARQSYLEAIAAPTIERLKDAEILFDSAKETARRANYEADKLVKGTKEILPLPASERPASPVAHLSDGDKARLIGAIGGHEAYKEIVAGTRELPPAFWNNEAKTSFIEKHGAENFEAFCRGEWQPPE